MGVPFRELINPMGFDPLAPVTRPAVIANPYIQWAEDATAKLYPYITNLFHELAQTHPQDIQIRSTYGRLEIDEMLHRPVAIDIEPKHQKGLYKNKIIFREGPCLVIEGNNGTSAQLIAFQSETPQGVDSIDYVLMYRPSDGKASALQGSYVPLISNAENYSEQRQYSYVHESALQLKRFIREIQWNVLAGHSEYQSHVIDGYDLNPYPDDPPDILTAKKVITALHHELFSKEHGSLRKVRYLRIGKADEHTYIPVPENMKNVHLLPQNNLLDGFGFTVMGKDMRCTFTVSPMPKHPEKCLLLVTYEGANVTGDAVSDTQGVILITTADNWQEVLGNEVNDVTYKL